jgi:D-xylose transport system permease protein
MEEVKKIEKTYHHRQFDIKKYFMLIALFVLWLVLAILTDGIFISPRNLTNLTRQMTFVIVLAIGMLNVIILSEIDLSVGSIVGLCGGMLAILTREYQVSLPVALLITVLLGFALGLWNGWWVAYRNVPAFIVTLAGLLIFRGTLVGITGGRTIAPLNKGLEWIGSGNLPNAMGMMVAVIISVFLVFLIWRGHAKSLAYNIDAGSKNFMIFKCVIIVVLIIGFAHVMNLYKGIPTAVVLISVLFCIFFFVTQKTVFGRRIYSIGGNKAASVLAGINVKKYTLLVFGLNGLLAAIASIFLCARLNSASVGAGLNSELDAIASCVIGGASLLGGIGSQPGVIIGATIMVSIDNGTALLNVPSFWQTIIKGLVLLLAVWFDMSKKKAD